MQSRKEGNAPQSVLSCSSEICSSSDGQAKCFYGQAKTELFGHNDRRSKGEAFKSESAVPAKKYGGGSTMLWGCFTVSGTDRLHSGWINEGGGLPLNSLTSPQLNRQKLDIT